MKSELLSRLIAAPLNLLYPVCCPLCGRDDHDGETLQPRLCNNCRDQLLPQTDSFCRRCGAVLGPNLLDDSSCRHCRSQRFAFSETVSLGTYAGVLRTACLKCQQPGKADLIRSLVSLLWELHGSRLRDWQVDLVSCIPQHWRKRLRGSINTSAELGQVLAQKLQVPFARQLLLKTRHTPDQTQSTPTERRQNLKGAFRVSFPALSRGRRILLADDVMTTGSTVEAGSRALKSASASEIFVAVVGRGLG